MSLHGTKGPQLSILRDVTPAICVEYREEEQQNSSILQIQTRHGTVRELYTVTHCCTVALSSVLRLNPWITLYFHLESTFVIDSYKEADWLFHFRQFGRKEQFYTLIWFYVHTFDYNAMNLMSLCMRKLQKFPKKISFVRAYAYRLESAREGQNKEKQLWKLNFFLF